MIGLRYFGVILNYPLLIKLDFPKKCKHLLDVLVWFADTPSFIIWTGVFRHNGIPQTSIMLLFFLWSK